MSKKYQHILEGAMNLPQNELYALAQARGNPFRKGEGDLRKRSDGQTEKKTGLAMSYPYDFHPKAEGEQFDAVFLDPQSAFYL